MSLTIDIASCYDMKLRIALICSRISSVVPILLTTSLRIFMMLLVMVGILQKRSLKFIKWLFMRDTLSLVTDIIIKTCESIACCDRLKTPLPLDRGVFARFGASKHRFSGRTFYQSHTWASSVTRPQPYFERSGSRMTTSLTTSNHRSLLYMYT